MLSRVLRNLCSKLGTFRKQEERKNHPKVYIWDETRYREIFLHFKSVKARVLQTKRRTESVTAYATAA